ncbi:uncharacterized protein LOC141684922 [Apium graveolens]|uniref:uncharacterized protein LOC141684922 n=1 Tax=Apium graveolens TaxID=4045 RepID=UPI003D7949BF
MRTKLADLWKPAMGINIKDLKHGIYLFQFYHKDDMQWVLTNGPWAFDNLTLVINIVKAGEDLIKVSLNEVEFWIQIHDLPYDTKNNSSIWHEYMRLRIKIDVRKPLKRKTKIVKKDKTEVVVTCKYEKLGDFCFICGLLTHTERFCNKKLETADGGITREWGKWVRAPPRRMTGNSISKWLRAEGDGDWG